MGKTSVLPRQVEGADLIARLDRVPIWPYRRTVLPIVGIGFFFCFFDIITIGAVIPVLKVQWGVSTVLLSWTITASLVGYVVGEFLDSRISDAWGRRLALYISVGLFSAGSILSATSTSVWWLVAWRFVSGMGIGAELSGTIAYLGEMAPRKLRGRITAIGVAYGFTAFAAVPFVAMFLVPSFDWGWRVLFLIGGVVAFIILWMRRHMPKTPRWLISHGRIDEARVIIEQAEVRAEKRLGNPLPEPKIEPLHELERKKWWALFRPPYVWMILLFAAIWSYYYIGNYAWLTLMPELYVEKGISLPNAFLVQGVASIGYIVGAIAAIYVSDRWERKWSTLVIALIWSISLLIVGWVPTTAVLLICGFAASITIAMFIPIMYTFTGETFPIWGRATGISMTDGVGHIAAAFCGQIVFGIGALFRGDGFSFEAALTTMAITGFLAVVLLTFGPRLTGQSLDGGSQ